MTATPTRVLMTGATGAFGRHVARALLGHGCELTVLARGDNVADAEARIFAALALETGHDRVSVVRGDVTAPALGLSRKANVRLSTAVDGVLHCAATTDFTLPLALARHSNVGGATNVVAFARGVRALRKFGFVSTAFVAGRRTGRILESQLVHDAGFVTTYERAKYEAEILVRELATDLPLAIFRPSVVVEPRAERLRRPTALRFVLQLIRRGVLPALPTVADMPLDLIAAGDAAHALAELFLAPVVGTFHLASGAKAPTVAEILELSRANAVRYVDGADFGRELAQLKRQRPAAAKTYDELDNYIRILSYPKLFDTVAAEALLGEPVRREDPLLELMPHAATPGDLERRTHSTRAERVTPKEVAA